MFSSILPVAGNNTERNRQAQLIRMWLWGWCHRQNFEFLDHGMVCKTPGLWETDGMHLSQRRETIIVQELAGLTGRTLKHIQRGKGIKPGLQVISYGTSHTNSASERNEEKTRTSETLQNPKPISSSHKYLLSTAVDQEQKLIRMTVPASQLFCSRAEFCSVIWSF